MAYAKHITDQLKINRKLNRTITVNITPDDADHIFVALDMHVEWQNGELQEKAKKTRQKFIDVLTETNTQVEVINSLAKVYQDWCTQNGFPQLSMDEHDPAAMDKTQIKELYRFIELWELANLDIDFNINGRFTL